MQFSRRKLISIVLALLMVLGLHGNIIPQANALIVGSNFAEEMPELPFHPRTVDVNSNGHIFILSYDQDVWRSTDHATSWIKVFDDGQDWTGVSPVTTRNFLTLLVDSRGYIFVNIFAAGSWRLHRSIDDGNSWAAILSNSRRSWHMDESSNGTLWFHTYTGPGWAAIYKSVDHGATWSVFQNLTMVAEDLRVVAVNDYNDDEIWAATSRRIMYWNGFEWITTHVDNRSQTCISSIWFDQNYVYLGAEYLGGKTANWRYPHSPAANPMADWANYDYYWDAGKLMLVANEHSFRGLRIGDIMLFGIRSQLWGSWDGTRWVKIADLGDAVASDIESISQRSPIYYVDKKRGVLYRLSVTKEDLVQLYYREYLIHRGNRVNQEHYVAECRIVNGTNQVDLTDVGLNDVAVAIKGLSRINYLNNSGFETGTTTGWWTSFSPGAGAYWASSEESHDGSYSLKLVKPITDTLDRYFWQDYLSTTRGDTIVFSAWVKGNTSLTNKFMLAWRNQTNGLLFKADYFNVTTSWTRAKTYYSMNIPNARIRMEFWGMKGATYELFVDSVQVEKSCVGIIWQEPDADVESIEHLQYQPSPYFEETLDTLSPSLILANQTVQHVGSLSNGTGSPPESLNGILTGAVGVDANIQGSGQAVLRITGTRILSAQNTVLRQLMNNSVFVGRCFAEPMVISDTTDFVVLADKEDNITNACCSSTNLRVDVFLPFGTSSLEVFIGDRGAPRSVVGTVSWIYDPASRMLSITMPDSSSVGVIVSWRLLGDINDDGVVNALDLVLLDDAYGGSGGPPPTVNWNPSADQNLDNYVDLSDLYILGKNYGRS